MSEQELNGLREHVRALRAELRQKSEYISVLEPLRSPQRRNDELAQYAMILRAIQQQKTTHNHRANQLGIVKQLLVNDLENKALREIHITLKAVQKLMRCISMGNYSHRSVKHILGLAIDVLDAGQEDMPVQIRKAETGAMHDTDEPVPPPKDMDDIPF